MGYRTQQTVRVVITS